MRAHRTSSSRAGSRASAALALTLAFGCDALPDIVGNIPPEVRPHPPGTAGAAGAAGTSSIPDPLTPPRGELSLTGELLAHDPSLVEADGTYYLFHLGVGTPYKTSTDLQHWEEAGRIFEQVPPNLSTALPDTTELWAPDVSFSGGVYHLYYAGSTFGTGKSCIGHATSPKLDGSASWTDEPLVICSNIDQTDPFDAVDPSAFTDVSGQRWLVFGSYHSGIKMLSLDSAGRAAGVPPISLAERPTEIAIQAAHLVYRDPYYYLIASFGQCCSGVNSTSSIHVGRATHVEGPYVDRDGVPMLEGGGTLLLSGDERYRAVGGATTLRSRGVDYLAYHAYDADAVGQAVLRITEFSIDADGWIVLEK